MICEMWLQYQRNNYDTIMFKACACIIIIFPLNLQERQNHYLRIIRCIMFKLLVIEKGIRNRRHWPFLVTYDNTPMLYTAIFHGCKNDNFQMKKKVIFSYVCSKHRLWIQVRTASVRRTHWAGFVFGLFHFLIFAYILFLIE